MGKASFCMLLEIVTLVIGNLINRQGLEFMFTSMVPNILGSGLKIDTMVRDQNHGQMVANSKEHMSMAKNTMVNSTLQTDHGTSVTL